MLLQKSFSPVCIWLVQLASIFYSVFYFYFLFRFLFHLITGRQLFIKACHYLKVLFQPQCSYSYSLKKMIWKKFLFYSLSPEEQCNANTKVPKRTSCTLIFSYKQPVYKQLALGWQIAKQLLGLDPFSLRNRKNYRLKKSGVFPL